MRSDLVGTIGFLLTIALLAAAPGVALAGEHGEGAPTSIIEGPDPIDNRCEVEVGSEGPEAPVDIVHDPKTGRPIAVWAPRVAEDHDIAFREQREDGWGPTVYLSSTLADDLGPRLALGPDGAIHVTWWQCGKGCRVLYTRRDPASGRWGVDHEVAPDGLRPAIFVDVDEGSPRIAFERRTSRGAEVLVARPGADGRFVSEVVGTTDHAGPLEPAWHEDAGVLWLGWKVGDDRVAVSAWTGKGWTAPEPLALRGTDWGVEELGELVDRRLSPNRP